MTKRAAFGLPTIALQSLGWSGVLSPSDYFYHSQYTLYILHTKVISVLGKICRVIGVSRINKFQLALSQCQLSNQP